MKTWGVKVRNSRGWWKLSEQCSRSKRAGKIRHGHDRRLEMEIWETGATMCVTVTAAR